MRRFSMPPAMWPSYHPEVFTTKKGTRYLKSPGAAVIAQTDTNLENLEPFLREFDFEGYLDDPVFLESGEALSKFGGQLCYMAMGEKRTHNEDAGRYFNNIKEQGHGSVLEHASVSVFMYGISRSLTHELVRHRAGTAFSQLSQRYVDGGLLRFVERPEYQDYGPLHDDFEKSIDEAAARYEWRAQTLLARQSEGDSIMSDDHRTGLRKRVNQAARSCLPNETETMIVFTGNVRSWRHIFEMRTAAGAEIEIRNLIFLCYTLLREIWPILTSDYEVEELPDGTKVLNTKYRKV